VRTRIALFALAAAVTAAASTRQGITRDEAYYVRAARLQLDYYADLLAGRLDAPFSDETIGRYWGYNHEHPPLFKTIAGLTMRAFRGVLGTVTAARVAGAIFAGLLVVLVHAVFREVLGGGAAGAITAAFLALAQPRMFFHAQTVSFDVAAAVLWLATTYAWWRALESGRWRPAIAVGLLYGLFLATKLQAFFLPLALGAHWLALRVGGARPSGKPILATVLLAPAVLLASWPWLWHDPVGRMLAYVRFHLHHVHYHFEYLGRDWTSPPFPWHEPLGMLLFTAPVVLLVLAAAGIVSLARTDQTDPLRTRMLLLLAGFTPIAVFLTGRAPIYGATKHWLATMPFLALAAGVAIERLAVALAEERVVARPVVATLLVALACAPAAAETWHSHPYGLSSYNALAGGAPGGADLGLNRQFWGYSVRGVWPWVNANLPPDARLYLHDCNHEAYELYHAAGELRFDIVSDSDPRDRIRFHHGTDAALVVHERHFGTVEYRIWNAYATVRPAYVLTLDGVPLVSVYRKEPQG